MFARRLALGVTPAVLAAALVLGTGPTLRAACGGVAAPTNTNREGAPPASSGLRVEVSLPANPGGEAPRFEEAAVRVEAGREATLAIEVKQ